jgi:FixJ family two-component response regulator
VNGPKPAEINLSDAERQALEKRLKAHSTEQQLVPRARIVLKASQGLNNAQIARELHVTIDTARLWRDCRPLLQRIALADLKESRWQKPRCRS